MEEIDALMADIKEYQTAEDDYKNMLRLSALQMHEKIKETN